MKQFFTFYIIYFIFIGCWSGKSAEQAKPNKLPIRATMHKVYLDSVKIVSQDKSVGEIRLLIRGHLPNPAYKIEGYEVEVKGDRVQIKPRVSYRSDMIVVQMLVPFEDTVHVKIPKPGHYKITVEGKERVLTQEIDFQ